MRVIVAGHQYALEHLDGTMEELLTFVKREGEGYPGNVGSHPGTNLQEVLRALIDRLKYLDRQIPCHYNHLTISHLQDAFRLLERRAAERHGRNCAPFDYGATANIEKLPTCTKCGHVLCAGTCR